MDNRKPIKPSNGHVITNGTIYSRCLYLGEGLSYDGFYEITEAEYEDIIAAEEDEAVRRLFDLYGVEYEEEKE